MLALLLGAALALGVQAVRLPPLVLGQDAISSPQSRAARVSLRRDAGPVIDIRPPQGETHTLLIDYPGGRVRPQAYEWLGRALAASGVQTLIPVFPLDLAVLDPDRADTLIDRFGAGKRVVLAGHSLGGAMAAGYAARFPQRLDALILHAAYPPPNTDLRDLSLPVLSLLAERDGVASPADVREGRQRLPSGTQLVTLPGAVHSFFGRSGPQRGDGQPAVSRAEAEAQILEAMQTFLQALPPRHR
ncbi:alpha/beta hydrolase [Deinococcus sp. RL]|uniref:alpha/beta fold hydrolase n=1 Tax=Deinococcus sp. RL TaxID=1489678 RepID=UPI0004D4C167|nr:alpha/beta fold hydrolase [Deinococcus sp. RL]KEF34784.1 alpha/beta hydrolase [Deinococcus sp. RL]